MCSMAAYSIAGSDECLCFVFSRRTMPVVLVTFPFHRVFFVWLGGVIHLKNPRNPGVKMTKYRETQIYSTKNAYKVAYVIRVSL
jgi:hypothetical protein